jgi:hypothetical protein
MEKGVETPALVLNFLTILMVYRIPETWLAGVDMFDNLVIAVLTFTEFRHNLPDVPYSARNSRLHCSAPITTARVDPIGTHTVSDHVRTGRVKSNRKNI